jgi:hypothetical protein
MSNLGKNTFHHADPIVGRRLERVNFEISAHKRYDEKRKPPKKNKDGRIKDLGCPTLRNKSNSRNNQNFQ